MGVWTTKHAVAHLASFEAVLIDVLTAVDDDDANTPVLDEFLAGPAQFVAMREHLAPDEVLRQFGRHCRMKSATSAWTASMASR